MGGQDGAQAGAVHAGQGPEVEHDAFGVAGIGSGERGLKLLDGLDVQLPAKLDPGVTAVPPAAQPEDRGGDLVERARSPLAKLLRRLASRPSCAPFTLGSPRSLP